MSLEITDNNLKKQIIFLLNNIWTGNCDMYFPLQNFVNIEKRYIYKLKNFDYLFYVKNTQETKRAILFLFLDSNGDNTAVIILKDFSIYKIGINCPDEYYVNTIFDISYTPEQVCIYDTFSVCGKKINRNSFEDRISEAEIFKHNIKDSGIPISVSKYDSDLNNITYSKNEGEEIFMIANDIPMVTGVNYSCFKWKPTELITFSLLAREENEDILLYSTMFKNEVLFAKIHNSNLEGSKFIEKIKNLDGYVSECIIDVNINNDNIDILNVNTFKTIPSTIRSIEKILAIKKENLNLDDLKF